MASDQGAVSIGEVLEVLTTYRADLIARDGEEKVKNLRPSDEWGNGRTSMTLLLSDPAKWAYLLNDEETRTAVYRNVLAFQESPAES